MGHKIFVSYKYADSNVQNISGNHWSQDTARTYVDKLADYIDSTDNIYKGEDDGDDLSELSDDTIWERLKDRIFDSTLTIVVISAGMREIGKRDRDQWIPWEISYSLKEESRKTKSGKTVGSFSNAMLAVVLPDKQGSYNYFTYMKSCCGNPCRYYNTGILFEILRKNMFNIINADSKTCVDGSIVYHGDCSYITSVVWDDFIKSPNDYIEKAYQIQSKIEQYEITKEF